MSYSTTRNEGTPARIAAVLFALLLGFATAASGQRPVPDTFTATTTAMTPDGLTLKIDVLEWSDEDARTAVIAALTGEADQSSLRSLPTVGYVWPSNSAVGYALKYAHRAPSAQGEGENITIVTDRSLGGYDFTPWKANAEATASTGGGASAGGASGAGGSASGGAGASGAGAGASGAGAGASGAGAGASGAGPDTNAGADYSVIELYLDADGTGVGNMSLAGDVSFDTQTQTVTLERGDGAAQVLRDAQAVPKPYWAGDGGG